MDVYEYKAELFCDGCGEEVKDKLVAAGKQPENPDDEETFDSGDFPKGPFPDGGGEADTPQHCAECNAFLHNPLTPEGYEYVAQKLAEGTGREDVLAEWAEAYPEAVEMSRGDTFAGP